MRWLVIFLLWLGWTCGVGSVVLVQHAIAQQAQRPYLCREYFDYDETGRYDKPQIVKAEAAFFWVDKSGNRCVGRFSDIPMECK